MGLRVELIPARGKLEIERSKNGPIWGGILSGFEAQKGQYLGVIFENLTNFRLDFREIYPQILLQLQEFTPWRTIKNI